mmetsp:Transcript_101502/g.291272  ORF Transcript_101502/g.291272 Transcript_101502/m.291272 type:complete len:251 (+) Transcript_101502:312-1064(+)
MPVGHLLSEAQRRQQDGHGGTHSSRPEVHGQKPAHGSSRKRNRRAQPQRNHLAQALAHDVRAHEPQRDAGAATEGRQPDACTADGLRFDQMHQGVELRASEDQNAGHGRQSRPLRHRGSAGARDLRARGGLHFVGDDPGLDRWQGTPQNLRLPRLQIHTRAHRQALRVPTLRRERAQQHPQRHRPRRGRHRRGRGGRGGREGEQHHRGEGQDEGPRHDDLAHVDTHRKAVQNGADHRKLRKHELRQQESQ